MKIKLFLIASLLIISNFLFAQVPSYVPSEGLVGWWPFNGNAEDESDYNNNGTIYGPTLTEDREGNSNAAYNFNGVFDYIEVLDDNSLDFTNSYSLSAWYRTTNNSAYNQTILGKGNDIGGSGYNMVVNSAIINYDNLQIQSGFNNGLGFVEGSINGAAMTPSIDIYTTNWHHIIGTYDGNTAKLFIDGVLVDTTQIEFSLSISEQPLLFGNESHSLYRYFEGDIDDIGMWNRVLTNKEIDDLYQSVNTNVSSNITYPVDFGSKVECYPNPTTDVINVDLSNLNDYSGQKLRIMNLSGQIVYEENVNQNKMVIDVKSLLSSGIYVLNTVDQHSNITSTNKFVVQ